MNREVEYNSNRKNGFSCRVYHVAPHRRLIEQQLFSGVGLKHIAVSLKLTVRNVKYHCEMIYADHGVSSRLEFMAQRIAELEGAPEKSTIANGTGIVQ